MIFLGIVLTLIYCLPIIKSGGSLGIQDWGQTFAWTEFSRLSIQEYRQFPYWNPYKCGGSAHFANPQAGVISIQTLLALIFGTVIGVKISLIFHIFLAFIGFYLLSRQYQISSLGSLTASIIFTFSGITSSFLSSGMVVFSNFGYTPFILYFFNLGKKNLKFALLAGVIYSLSFYYDYHIPLLLLVYILAYSLIETLLQKNLLTLKSLVILALSALFFSLPKLILSFGLLREYLIVINDDSGYKLSQIIYFLLSRNQALGMPLKVSGYSYEIDENSLYLGPVPLLLFISFFVINKTRLKKHLSLILILLVIFFLMLGHKVIFSPYSVLRLLPLFSSFRVAQRFRFDLIIPLALIIGLGHQSLFKFMANISQAWQRIIKTLIISAIVFDLFSLSHSNFLKYSLIIKPSDYDFKVEKNFVQHKGRYLSKPLNYESDLPSSLKNSAAFSPWTHEYSKILKNVGVIDCYDPLITRKSAKGSDESDYRGEYYVLNPAGEKTLEPELIFWSPNLLKLEMPEGKSLANHTLIINQNYYPGWFRRRGDRLERAVQRFGLISTPLKDGDRRIIIEFHPWRDLIL